MLAHSKFSFTFCSKYDHVRYLMFNFKEALRAAQSRLMPLVSIQEPIYSVQENTLGPLVSSVLEGTLASDPNKARFLANTILAAVRANPKNTEIYADLITRVSKQAPAFAGAIPRAIWRDFNDPAIQFLIVLLIERGILTTQNLIDRAISAARPKLSPEVGFYFFPEWATDDHFFQKHLEADSGRFAAWDQKYTQQCDPRHNGRDLSEDDYRLFRELRRKGRNHNSLAQMLAADDQDSLIPLVDENKIDVNAMLPMSLFERCKYGKTKPIRVIEYCALSGASKCFKYLLDNNAEIGPRVPKYAAMLGHSEIIQLAFTRRIPLEPAMIGGIKGHHFSLLKALRDHQHVPIRAKAVFAMAQYKYKGFAFLLSWNVDFNDVMSDAAPLQAEDRSVVGYEHILLMRAAEIDDRFLVNVICGIEGFNPFVETNQRYPTALIAAAASNSVDVLRHLVSLRGADVNRESRGETPLIAATKNNALEAIEMLGTVDVLDPNRRVEGRSALMIAREVDAMATCQALLRLKGIDPN
jgi:hypothetical protein